MALLVFSGCTKYDDTAAAKTLKVPPYTETGANTFGCLLNGQVWANFGATVIHQELGTTKIDTSKVTSFIQWSAYPQTDTVFYVRAAYSLVKKGRELRDEFMSIQLPKHGSLKGIHLLTDTGAVFQYSQILSGQYSSKARKPFTVIINRDSVVNGYRHIVSGRFYGVLYNFAQTDSVSISGGVFDTLTR